MKDLIDETAYVDALPANQWCGSRRGSSRPRQAGAHHKIGTPLSCRSSAPLPTRLELSFAIIDWAAIVIESVDWSGPGGRQLTGHFVTYIASDLAAGTPASGATDFGVHVISLIQ